MEYYIYTTYDCNLACAYCSASRVVNRQAISLDERQIQGTTEYIRSDVQKRGNAANSIIFFGGEPTLVPDTIKIIIDRTGGLNLTYHLYTNGVDLDKFPLELLDAMTIVFVSIDGNRETHEKYRGKATYDRILDNVSMIRPRSRSKFLSRITLEEDVNIFSCATNLLPLFDFVHWQIVNKPKFSSPSMFADHYGNEVRQLFEYWCTELEKGHVLGIIPFQSLVNSLLFPEQMDRRSFRCKSGTELQVIDMRGNIYECDEYVGDLSKSIGNIESGAVHDLVYESHESLFAACKECSVTHICLGRCRKCLKYYSKEQIINYCLLTKSLLTVILEQMDRIKTIVSQQKMTSEVLYNKPYYNFEEIP